MLHLLRQGDSASDVQWSWNGSGGSAFIPSVPGLHESTVSSLMTCFSTDPDARWMHGSTYSACAQYIIAGLSGICL